MPGGGAGWAKRCKCLLVILASRPADVELREFESWVRSAGEKQRRREGAGKEKEEEEAGMVWENAPVRQFDEHVRRTAEGRTVRKSSGMASKREEGDVEF